MEAGRKAGWRSSVSSAWMRFWRCLEYLSDGADVTEASLLRKRVEKLERQVAKLVPIDISHTRRER